MSGRIAPWRWPLALKVPLLVTLLMVCVAAGISKLVLLRLEQSQSDHFTDLTGAYLDGLSTALMPAVTRRDPWEAFDALDRSRSRYAGLAVRRVFVVLPDETILAASDPMEHPLGSPVPAEARNGGVVPSVASAPGTVWIHRALVEGSVLVGRIAAEIDVGALAEERRTALWALLAVNTALTLLLAGLGWLLVQRMLRPVMQLSRRLARASDGRLEPIPPHEMPPAGTDEGRAFRHYNAAAAAVAEREALLTRLAGEERRALVGRLASAMAHEVNNPLGGLFNAVRMIQRHGDNPEHRARAALLLERGLTGIHNVVRASLLLWRGEAEDRLLSGADIDDLRFLVESEAQRREVTLDWHQDLAPTINVPAQPVRQLALNLLLNACAASPPGATLRMAAWNEAGHLVLRIADEGPGLPAGARAMLLGGAEEGPPDAGGLGLWTVARLCRELGITIEIAGPPGTTILVRIPHAERPALHAA